MLYNAYNEYNGVDNNEIQQDFEDLYEAMHGKPLREKDRASTPSVAFAETTKTAASPTESD